MVTLNSTEITLMQMDIFPQDSGRCWQLPGGRLELVQDFLPEQLHNKLFDQLANKLEWEQSWINIAGKQIRIPRLNAWYGDTCAEYQYSGTRFQAHPWTDTLVRARDLIQQHCDRQFNSILANLYREGQDSVAWHADDETELGRDSFIASLSLGQVRRLQLKHRRDKALSRIDIDLTDNTLLLMGDSLQHNWIHQVPKTRKPVGPRINLTFRWVHSI